jgi:hypothetical protein
MQSHPKIKPPQANENSASVFIMGAVLVGIVMIIIGMVAASSDDLQPEPTPTFIPAPRLADGSALEVGMTAYVLEEIAFAGVAAAGNENPEQTLAACTPVTIQNGPVDLYFSLDSTVNPPIYWVYAIAEDENGWNGWLPFSVISTALPEACPE